MPWLRQPGRSNTAGKRHRVVLDGVEYVGSDPLWLGPDKRLAIGIQLSDGSLQGHSVEVVVGEVLTYRSLGVVEQAVALKVITLMQQAG
jgi:hypothetical protein